MNLKRCKTCGCYLIFSFLVIGFPWTKRVKRFKEAVDCIDLLPIKIVEKFKKESTDGENS